MEKLINKYICFRDNLPNHDILDELASHELTQLEMLI